MWDGDLTRIAQQVSVEGAVGVHTFVPSRPATCTRVGDELQQVPFANIEQTRIAGVSCKSMEATLVE